MGHKFGFLDQSAWTHPFVLLKIGEELHLHYGSARRVAEAAVESAMERFQRTGSARRWFFLHRMANAVNWKLVKSGPQES